MDQDPKQNHSTQEQQASWELSKGRSALATVALNGALLLNGALPHGELVDLHTNRTEHVQEVVVDEVTREVTSTMLGLNETSGPKVVHWTCHLISFQQLSRLKT